MYNLIVREMNIQEITCKATGPNGFHIALPNGYTVSVQWGYGTYSENQYILPTSANEYRTQELYSETAEVAIFDPSGRMMVFEDGDTVMGWQSKDQVLETIRKTSLL